MRSSTFAALSVALPLASAQQLTNETVLGVYMFHRHGDRTAKLTPPANLTDLGYQEVYTSGNYYRSRYIDSEAAYKIHGINSDLVKESQLAISSPSDTVLQNSATGFLQGLYPPVGTGLDTETLRNGTVITSPMQGYQLIPVAITTAGSGSEDNGWLQAASGCEAATISSNEYFLSDQYMTLLSSTQDFYNRLDPVTSGVYNASETSYKNAYTIFDYINVAEIRNITWPTADLVNSSTFFQLRTLADTHEWGLAYNASNNMRAIAGKTLAAQIVQALNTTITGNGTTPLNIQFGTYGTFSSFFGLAMPNIETIAPDLMGVADYASAMSIEMFTNTSATVSSTSYPGVDDIYVRMLFHNGTTSNISQPHVYPLFGQAQDAVSWNDFATNIDKFAIGTTEQWCTACGNYTGTCAAYAPSSSSGSSTTSASKSGSSGNGLSPAVNGVIGAMVTLAVILGLEALAMLLFGLRLVSKKRLAGTPGRVSPVDGGALKA